MIWKKKDGVVVAKTVVAEEVKAPLAPAEIRVEPPKKDEGFSLNFSREEVEARVMDLQKDEDITLFVRTMEGQRKYNELVQLRDLLK